jgi:HlyD family secretion protein
MHGSWKRNLALAAIAVLVAGALVYAFLPQPVPADLAEVVRGTLKVTVEDEGRTRVKEVYVVSAPVGGRVLRIERHVGDPVKAGETVLATIRPTDPTFLDLRGKRQAEAAAHGAEAAVQLAEAELKRVQAELVFARSDLARARKLASGDTISQKALDRAVLEFKTHEAAVAAAEATLRVKNFDLETARASLIEPGSDRAIGREENCCVTVRAPVDGSVLGLLQESEAVIGAGAPLVQIGDPRDLEIVVDLLSRDAVRIREGAEVAIDEWGGGVTVKGRVRRIEPTGFTKVSALGIEEQRVNVVIDFTDPPSLWQSLGHGYRVETAIVVWQGEDLVKAPVSALFRDGEAWAVFVVIEGRAQVRRVAVGHRNSHEAEILEGLDESETVVLYPSDRIEEGVRVTPRPGG